MARKQRIKSKTPLTVSAPALLNDAGDDDSEFRQLVHGLLAFSKEIESVRNGFAEHLGLSGIQYTILISIAHLTPAQTVEVNTIARHLHLSGAFVTMETRKLLEQGLVNKVPNPDDRRRVMLTITARGEALLAELAPIQREVNDVLFKTIKPGQLQQVLELVAGLLDGGTHANALLGHLLTLHGRRHSA